MQKNHQHLKAQINLKSKKFLKMELLLNVETINIQT